MARFFCRYGRVLLVLPALVLAAVAAAHGLDAHASIAGCNWDGTVCPTFAHSLK